MFGFPPAQHFTPTRWLHDGDTVQAGNETLNAPLPGHTPGHVVFHAPQIDRAFVGDVSVCRQHWAQPIFRRATP